MPRSLLWRSSLTDAHFFAFFISHFCVHLTVRSVIETIAPHQWICQWHIRICVLWKAHSFFCNDSFIIIYFTLTVLWNIATNRINQSNEGEQMIAMSSILNRFNWNKVKVNYFVVCDGERSTIDAELKIVPVDRKLCYNVKILNDIFDLLVKWQVRLNTM